MIDYLQELRSNVILCYSTMATAAKEASMQQQYLIAAPGMFDFFQATIKILLPDQQLVSSHTLFLNFVDRKFALRSVVCSGTCVTAWVSMWPSCFSSRGWNS